MKRSFDTRALARCSILAALGVVLMYVSAVIPSAKIALVAIAGVLNAAAVIHHGKLRALFVFVAVSLLSLLLLPQKGCAVMYIVFFGYYPIIKSVFERLRSAALGWAAKIALFNAVFFALWFIARELFLLVLPLDNVGLPIVWLAANAAFVVYDIGLSKLIALYISRFSGGYK